MHNAHVGSLHGHFPSTKVNPERHFVHVPYSCVSHSSHEYSKQGELPQFIVLFENIIIIKNKKIF